MKKTAVLFIGATALLGAAAIHFGWAEKWMPELWVETHKKAVRDRSEEFLQCLVDNDVERCVEMIDPIFVSEEGEFATHRRIGLLMLLANITEFTADDIELSDVADVELSDDHQTATIGVVAEVRGVSSPRKSWKWVRRGRQWYYAP